MTDVVEVLDSIMGSSKTNGIIKWIEENPNEKYLYISPLLSEVEIGGRIHSDLKIVSFETPSTEDSKTKSDDLLKLLQDGCNIACTHSLYLGMSAEHLKAVEDNKYVLIIDEEIDVIDGYNRYSKDDLEYLLQRGDITFDDKDGMISWVGGELGSHAKYREFMNLCNAKALYATRRNKAMMVTQLPIKLITSAKRVIVMTYMFKGNILDCFLKLKGIKTKPFTEFACVQKSKVEIRELIDLKELPRQLSKLSLTSTGYEKMTKSDCSVVANYIRSVCRAHKAKGEDVIYTFPKAKFTGDDRSKTRNKVTPKGYTTYTVVVQEEVDGVLVERKEKHPCWLYSGCRATNLYAHKWCLVHVYDRYPLQAVASYLDDFGYRIDNNTFALSEMLQWIWRSRIRKGEKITLAIGSKRMYNLFVNWLATD